MGSKGKSFPWLPTDRQGLAAADQGKASEALLVFIGKCRIMTRQRHGAGREEEERKIILLSGGFARRKIQVFLRQCPLFPPHDLRSTALRYDEGRCSTLEVADMPAISHSNPPVAGPVFARSGMVRSWARIVLWQSGKGQRQTASGLFSHPLTTCRSTTRQSPILASGNLSACLRDRLPVNSSKPNRSAPPAIASAVKEASL